MTGGDRAVGMVPVGRAELVTQDMGMVADMIRELYVEHAAKFRCDDPGQVDGRIRTAAAGELTAGLLGYGGFVYGAALDPITAPTAITVRRGRGVITSAREQVCYAPGDVYLVPTDLTSRAVMDDARYATMSVPLEVAACLAEECTGLPAASLRFKAMAPVSAARQAMVARTTSLVCGQLVTSGATEVNQLLAQEMTRLAAAAILEGFPNTAMTAPYLPGPGWVAPASVRRAAAFIDAHAGRPVTVAEIAAVARVTIRALQHAFGQHYGVTPTGYLRRARLERAHMDLEDAGRGDGVTVAAVARAWGWASPGQFAAAYRRRFGVPPGRTLRA